MLKPGFFRSWRFWSVLAILVVLLGGAVYFLNTTGAPDPAVLTAAETALKDNHLDDALRLARDYLGKAPKSAAARLIAAQAWHKLKRGDEALEILAEVDSEDSSAQAIECANLAGIICIEQGRYWDAENHFRQAIRHSPHNMLAHRQLVEVLTVEGRRWDSRPHLLELISQKNIFFEELIILGDLWPVYENRDELNRIRKEQPHDPLSLVVPARIATRNKEDVKARSMIQKVLEKYPDLLEAHVWLGWTYSQSPKETAGLAQWEKGLPPGASDHPTIWLVRGMGAEQLGQQEAAVRCFWEAAVRDPNYDLAVYKLADALSAIKETEAHEIVSRRSEILLELNATIKKIHRAKQYEPESYRYVAEKMLALGRLREAWAWHQVIASRDPTQGWATAEVERLKKHLEGPPCLSLAEAEPRLKLDFAKYPLPEWPESSSPPVAGKGPKPASAVRFADLAAEAGIKFVYYNGDTPDKMRLIGDLGGGVAIFDYDGDFWPDIYLTQGSDWPVDSSSNQYRDRLFRNLGNGSFEDVTESAGLGDNNFSFGIATGDFDNDGFTDLYLANCGVNRLYHNNGDGTFTDVAHEAGITAEDWTASCLIADLNGDGLPDLFSVNYLEGDALTRLCNTGPCGPHLFPAQQDRLLINWGDGTFRDVTRNAGITAKDGKGLGIVAADFGGTGSLSMFIANDTTANHYYDNLTPRGEIIPRFSEKGVVSGLGHDRNGVPQACMGVAADDANGDGFIDLFITNFYNESNTLYVPEEPGKSYRDRTAEFGLREGSLLMLGFGTQFIDGELDGWPDLILTNGHVHNRTKEGIPFKMRPQYFRNLGGKTFEEVAPDSLGPFFKKEFLGRGLAKGDWNRDGREDVVISHIDDPAALLTNQTPTAGHYVALQFRGTTGCREPIGAIAKVKIGSRIITRQLIAGDGYQASNQRQLIFGLGSAENIDELEIRWPGGAEQKFTEVAVDAQYIAVEGRETLVQLQPPTTK